MAYIYFEVTLNTEQEPLQYTTPLKPNRQVRNLLNRTAAHQSRSYAGYEAPSPELKGNKTHVFTAGGEHACIELS